MKPINAVIILALATLFLTSFHASAQTTEQVPKDQEVVKLIEQIAGTWKLQSVVDSKKGKKNVNAGATEKSNAFQMLEFDTEGRYKSNNGTNAVDSGSYRMNEGGGILYLESDSDDNTPSEWNIAFNDNLMTISGRGADAHTKRFKYIYKQTESGVNTINGSE